MASRKTVAVFLLRPGVDEERISLTLQAPLPLEVLLAHSVTFQRFIHQEPENNENHREVTLACGDPGALRHIFGIIRAHHGAQGFYVNTAGFSTMRCVKLWEACEIIVLEPEDAMGQMMGRLRYNISHEKVTPDVMEEIHRIFRPSRAPNDKYRRRPWDILVNQYCWDITKGHHSPDEQKALERTYEPYPELADAIAAKMQSVTQRQAENTARIAARPSKKWLESHWKQRSMQEKAAEVKAGLRAWTPEIDPYFH